ncbi:MULTISPECIES: hypothetical protein [unclassified Streptomyces]|uniref:hypothetical protein n=1 Tax=unclassified Streptomyces TaxID=2593676 RepID=UPI002035BF54|nr:MULTISPECIES: hypothetical protein [unclassified Streptomyces]
MTGQSSAQPLHSADGLRPTHRANSRTANQEGSRTDNRPGKCATGVAAALHWAASRYSFVEEEVAGLDEFVAPGDVCLDIGAEYGLYTWTLAALAGPSGGVHSVEPLPGPARWLAAHRRPPAGLPQRHTPSGLVAGRPVARLSRRVGTGFHGSGGVIRLVGTGKSAGQPGFGRASSRWIAVVITSVQGQ